MPTLQQASQVLDRHYLEMRCGILDLAATLDRIERAANADQVSDDPRLKLIREGIEILCSSGTDRAERIQLLFSDQYDPDWKSKSPSVQ